MTSSKFLPTGAGSTAPAASSPAPDEVRLLQRLARRDSGAVAEVYALYGGPIFSYALRALGSREDAEEVLQDTFLRLWEKAAEYDPTLGRPFTWVFLLARGFCLDRQRRFGRRTRRLRTMAMETGAGTDAALPRIFPQDELRRVLAALAILPASDRRAVEMAVFLEYTGQEIADDTQEPLGTVKSRVRRGLARLRQLLKQHD